MAKLSCLFVLSIVWFLGDISCRPTKETPFNPFPFGIIGCLMSDVCESEEICTSDLLVGCCQSILRRDQQITENKIELGIREIKLLEYEITWLIENGFTWKDQLTQCTIQNTFLELSKGRTFNKYLCEKAFSLEPLELSGDVYSRPIKYFPKILPTRRDFPKTLAESMALINPNKRDEIVQIHKYYDMSSGMKKRNAYFDNKAYIYQQKDPFQDSLYPSRKYLLEELRESAKDPLVDSDDSRQGPPKHEPLTDPLNMDILMPLLNRKVLSTDQNSIATQNDSGFPGVKEIIETLVLAPGDEELLEQLLQGKLSPKDLNTKKQRRLQTFMKALIRVLEDSDRNIELASKGATANKGRSAERDHTELSENEDKGDSRRGRVVYPSYLVREHNSKSDDFMRGRFSNNFHLMDQPAKDDQDIEEQKAWLPSCIEADVVCLQLSKQVSNAAGEQFVRKLSEILRLPPGLIAFYRVGPGPFISLTLQPDHHENWDAHKIAMAAKNANVELKKNTGITVLQTQTKKDGKAVVEKKGNNYVALTFILLSIISGAMLAGATVYLIKRQARSHRKLSDITNRAPGSDTRRDNKDLSRQLLQNKLSGRSELSYAASSRGSVSESPPRSPSSRSSTSPWSEEPASTSMDIITGLIILSYMQDHLKNQDRLDKEWEAVANYVPDSFSTHAARDQSNQRKNRIADIIPYDHSRVILSSVANVSRSDYINASYITDHDPRNPAYICTQGPLLHTVADFWQIVWEQRSVVIVMLTRLEDDGETLCHRYWPEEGSDLYHIYEVHLVSVHMWCDDYVVRNFYLKNVKTSETRTVTQFHFLTWPEFSVPSSMKAFLDFRRKVNKSFRGRSCPIVVHCSDGCSRSGTYCLIDMVLNKITKGAKEIDIAATLEHIRDQRMSMVKTKEQFEFSLAAVAEEVHAVLRALPQ